MARRFHTNCARCDWEYPDEYLNPVIGSMVHGRVCGICALEITNEIHGLTRTQFKGDMAEMMRCDAVLWRQQNPSFAPKVR